MNSEFLQELNGLFAPQQAEPPPQPEPWEQPIPFDEITLPDFPTQALPKVLSEYILAIAEDTQTPPEMASMAVLGTLATALQGKFKISPKNGYCEPVNIYTCIVAPPAERKSAIMRAITAPIYEFEAAEAERIKPVIAQKQAEKSILEKQAKTTQDKAARTGGTDEKYEALAIATELDEFKIPVVPRFLCDDCTPEKLGSLMAEQGGKMGIFSAEGGVFDFMAGGYSKSINIDIYLKSHAGDFLRIDRINRASESIAEPSLTFVLAVQPDVLQGLMDNSIFRGRGLTARFLYCFPKSKVGRRLIETKAMPFNIRQAYRDLIITLLSHKPDSIQTIELSEQAYAYYIAFAEQIETRLLSDLEALADWGGKLCGAVLRMAALLHCAEHKAAAASVPLKKETFLNAVRIGEYLIEHAKAAYCLMGADKDVANAKYILKHFRGDRMSRRDLYRECRGRFKSSDDMSSTLELLEQHNFIRLQAQSILDGVGRKPSTVYLLNPMCGQNGHNGQN